MGRKAPPRILGVNPWIHDFAAYDFWSKPLGLLSLLGILKAHGYRISYLDCTDRFHPRAPNRDPQSRHGRGPFRKTPIAPPPALRNVPRQYSRYGIDPLWLVADLKALPAPDLILVTSMMTYWYPGVEETIAVVKRVFPRVPVVLGGIYTALCRQHARQNTGADYVADQVGEKNILSLVSDLTGFATESSRGPTAFDPADLDTYPYPLHGQQHRISCVPVLTTRGCPFKCPYCAAGFLAPDFLRRTPAAVAREIGHWHQTRGVRDFVFYDDALLIQAEDHFLPLARKISRNFSGLRFHTPNALHIREINSQVAGAMFRCGFETVRLGLETADFEARQAFDNKVTRPEFERAVACLKAAGFKSDQIGAYVLAGLPGQSLASVKKSLQIVRRQGITPIVAYYTPIPHTDWWEAAVACSPYDLEADPVFSNNALFPCRPEGFSWQQRTELLEEKTEGNAK